MKITTFGLFAAFALLSHVGMASAADPVEEYRQAMAIAQEQFQESAGIATAQYIAALKQSLTEETKKGNLEAAIAIRDQIKSLEQVSPIANVIVDKLAGTDWVNSNGVPFQWKEDGTFLHHGVPRASVPIDSRRVAIVFANAKVGVLVFNDSFTTFEQWGHESQDRPLFKGKKVSLKQ